VEDCHFAWGVISIKVLEGGGEEGRAGRGLSVR
jgi:hypothetical protein